MKFYLPVVFFVCAHLLLFGQKVTPAKENSGRTSSAETTDLKENFDHTIAWKGVMDFRALDDRVVRQIFCNPCRQRGEQYIPYWVSYVDLRPGMDTLSVRLAKTSVSQLSPEEQSGLDVNEIAGDFNVAVSIGTSSGQKIAVVKVEVLRNRGGIVEKLDAFDLDMVQLKGSQRGGNRGSHSWKSTSILSNGTWLKIATGEDGIYKVSFKDLQNFGLNPGALLSSQIRVYGTPAGMLSMNNSQQRPDDLEPVAIKVVDGGDGSFDQGDYFLFYGEDQVKWQLIDNRYVHEGNYFADSNYYFLNITGEGVMARVPVFAEQDPANHQSSSHDYFGVHEQDLSNLIKSGRTWYGEQLGSVQFYDFGFSVPNIDRSSNVWLRTKYAARSISLSGVKISMSLPNQGGVDAEAAVDPVADFYGALFADNGTLTLSTSPVDGNLLTKISLDNAANPLAQGWIDFIEFNARRNLVFLPPYMSFHDKLSVAAGRITEFTITANEAISVWDISNPIAPVEMQLSGGVVNGFRFKRQTEALLEFAVFSEESFKSPKKVHFVPNQNLHGEEGIEYVIVAYPSFVSQAERLASLHQNTEGMTTLVVTPEQVYNEFSGGVQDVTAIKEFMRKLYFESDSTGALPLRYLLLLGDASYDYKDRIAGNSNFVPTHQMANSLSPTSSIASDDFYGLLDDDEGESPNDFLDIGIGRLPARNRKEAEDMVNKIIAYANTSTSFGEWRNVVAFVADDADPRDGHTFMKDFESLGGIVDEDAPEYLIRKLYMDAFKQEVGSGGERYPEGVQAISQRVEKGALMMYYIGHGGELGWSHERILEVSTINKWDNTKNLPLFVTATCEFARFDDPRRTSGGEYVLLNPNGGGIALLTTTRAVFANPNLLLSTAFTIEAFENLISGKPRLGDLMLRTKVRTIDTDTYAALNSRSFALLGDPALKLAYPELNIRITEMPDTIKALDKVKVSGFIADAQGQKVEDFNGLLYPSVFDKEAAMQTLNNDGFGEFNFGEWKNLVFKGKTSVKNGEFSFEFVVPKDINKSYGPGRINLYAEDGGIDANGDYRAFMIGGLSDNPVVDNAGPIAELYMNNTKFVFGGLTDEDPDLYAEVSDDNGINMVGSGVGHDITAVLDNNTSKTLILNDFYESVVDSYTEGTIRYPFKTLEEGRHTLKLKVWDVNNNPTEAYTEFVVANTEEFALAHVLNYPNPFTTNTQFFFEHNKPGQPLDVKIDVFTVAGKLVKTLSADIYSDGYRVGPIPWNGRDEYGDVLAKGVYLYKVSVKTAIGESVEMYERLVLLK